MYKPVVNDLNAPTISPKGDVGAADTRADVAVTDAAGTGAARTDTAGTDAAGADAAGDVVGATLVVALDLATSADSRSSITEAAGVGATTRVAPTGACLATIPAAVTTMMPWM